MADKKTKQTKFTHGGARKGAGRKRSPNPKKAYAFYLSEEARERIRRLRAAGCKTNSIMEKFLEHAEKTLADKK